jgi:hypothetical protein
MIGCPASFWVGSDEKNMTELLPDEQGEVGENSIQDAMEVDLEK